jgi:hypothetical protein
MSDKDKRQRPQVFLSNCKAWGNGKAGFRFEGVEVVGKDLEAWDNGEGGIEVIDSHAELDDPETK